MQYIIRIPIIAPGIMSPRYLMILGTSLLPNAAKGISLVAKVVTPATRTVIII